MTDADRLTHRDSYVDYQTPQADGLTVLVERVRFRSYMIRCGACGWDGGKDSRFWTKPRREDGPPLRGDELDVSHLKCPRGCNPSSAPTSTPPAVQAAPDPTQPRDL